MTFAGLRLLQPLLAFATLCLPVACATPPKPPELAAFERFAASPRQNKQRSLLRTS